MEEVMNELAEAKDPRIPRVSRKNNGFSREDVVGAFQSAFEIIGGVNRLALWANANPDKFYPLYSKLLPATTIALGNPGVLEIVHRIAPTALDRHPDEQECLELNSDTSQEAISSPSTQEITDGESLLPIEEPEKPSQQSTT